MPKLSLLYLPGNDAVFSAERWEIQHKAVGA